jgi:hypothetical protein
MRSTRRIHLFFFDELAARNLLNANLHLSLKPLVIGEHLRNRFLHEVVRCPAGLGRKGTQLSFLLLRQMHFHTTSRVKRANGHLNAGLNGWNGRGGTGSNVRAPVLF